MLGLSAALYDSGVKAITSVDFSTTAQSLQQERNRERKGMKFLVPVLDLSLLLKCVADLTGIAGGGCEVDELRRGLL